MSNGGLSVFIQRVVAVGGSKDADVADDRFGGEEFVVGIGSAAIDLEFLREEHVDAVAGEDEAGDPLFLRDLHRYRAHAGAERGGQERKSVVEGKSVAGRVDLGGRGIIKKKKKKVVKAVRKA